MIRNRRIQLLLVDNQPSIRLRLEASLEATEVALTAEATTGAAALAQIRTKTPDLVLLGHTRDAGNDEAELGRIRREFPRLPVIAFAAFDSPLFIAQAVLGGAQGYLLKSAPLDDLLAIVRRAARGECCWNASQLEQIAGPHGAGAPLLFPLTATEREVLWRLGSGIAPDDVASGLDVSLASLYRAVRSLHRKLNSWSRLAPLDPPAPSRVISSQPTTF